MPEELSGWNELEMVSGATESTSEKVAKLLGCRGHLEGAGILRHTDVVQALARFLTVWVI